MSAALRQDSPELYQNSDLWDLSIELHDRPRSISVMPDCYQSSSLTHLSTASAFQTSKSEENTRIPQQEKEDLVHRVHIQYSKLDWVILLLYLAGLYGFLVFMTYLLLLATNTDSHLTGIVHFSLLLFTVGVTLLFIVAAKIEQRRKRLRVNCQRSVSKVNLEG